MSQDLTVIILTKNEELHIARVLENVRDLAQSVVVVDSFSTDNTVDIARADGAVVLQHAFVNQAKQFQWALDNASIATGWVMRLDADELVEPDLRQELEQRLGGLPPDVVGINLKRKHIFLGRWVRHGGRYPLLMLRIWRNGHGRVEDRWMDEHVTVWGGRTVTFEGNFADHNLNDLTYFTDKHNRYATREALEVMIRRYRLQPRDDLLDAKSTSSQAATKRFIKEKVYNRIPFAVSSALYFVWRYLFQLGFLDGPAGLVYHFLQGYWYRFLVGAKVSELETSIRGLHDAASIKTRLLAVTGHDLDTQT